MPQAEPSNISADAGNPQTLSDPNSPEAIARRAQQSEAQASEDKRYDPAPASGFQDYIVVWEDEQKRSQEISMALFLTLATLLFLYKAAPDRL